VFICNECIDLCYEIIHPPEDEKPPQVVGFGETVDYQRSRLM
jgi:hypothetical protein